MINPSTISETLLYSTVRIESKNKNNQTSVGSGFIYNVKLDDKRVVPVIITNKHVVNAMQTAVYQIHEAKESDGKLIPSGNNITVNMNDFESHWICHPKETIDLCAMLFQPIREQAQHNGKALYVSPLDETIIWDDRKLEDLSVVEDVLMVGYPIGLWDDAHNYPIIRRGITAIHPAIDFKNQSVGVVDIAAFPGSSGSPILIVNEGTYSMKRKAAIVAGNRVILLGVLFAGPQYNAEGQLEIRDIPTKQAAIASTMIPTNIGYYVKAKEIIKLGEHLVTTLKQKGYL